MVSVTETVMKKMFNHEYASVQRLILNELSAFKKHNHLISLSLEKM